MSDVLDACAKDVQAIRKHSEAMRQQGVERRAASVAKANAPAKGQAKGGAAR